MHSYYIVGYFDNNLDVLCLEHAKAFGYKDHEHQITSNDLEWTGNPEDTITCTACGKLLASKQVHYTWLAPAPPTPMEEVRHAVGREINTILSIFGLE